MAYCSIADLIDDQGERVLVQLTDDNNPPVAINQAKCLAVIDDASEIIDGRLRGRYSNLPIPEPVPAMIRSMCVDIAIYKLYSRRNQGNVENVRARYRDALDNLDKIKLGEQSPAIASASVEYKSSKRRNQRIYTDELWEHF